MKKFIRLENLIYFTIAGLPLYFIKLSFFGISLNILDILEAAAFAWWILDKNYPKPIAKELFFHYKNYIIAISLILFGLAVSVLVNGEYRTGLGIIKSWFALPILFIFTTMNVLVNEKRKNAFKIFYGSAFVVALISLAYFFAGQLTFDGRLEGFFNSPNYLAMYLSPALIIGLALAQSQKSKVKSQKEDFRIFYRISCAAILSSLYMTYSYAAWIAVIVSLLITEAAIKSRSIGKSKIFLGSVILLVFLFALQLNSGKFRNIYNISNRSSLFSRVMIWKSAGKIAMDNPVWGIGPGNFQKKYLEYQKFFPPYLEWAVPHPHNLYLAFWLQSGLFGLAGFVALLYFWLRSILSADDSLPKTIAFGLMFYILIHGLVDTTYFKNDLAVIFWLSFLAIKPPANTLVRGENLRQ